jgi:hypothetical protein
MTEHDMSDAFPCQDSAVRIPAEQQQQHLTLIASAKRKRGEATARQGLRARPRAALGCGAPAAWRRPVPNPPACRADRGRGRPLTAVFDPAGDQDAAAARGKRSRAVEPFVTRLETVYDTAQVDACALVRGPRRWMSGGCHPRGPPCDPSAPSGAGRSWSPACPAAHAVANLRPPQAHLPAANAAGSPSLLGALFSPVFVLLKGGEQQHQAASDHSEQEQLNLQQQEEVKVVNSRASLQVPPGAQEGQPQPDDNATVRVQQQQEEQQHRARQEQPQHEPSPPRQQQEQAAGCAGQEQQQPQEQEPQQEQQQQQQGDEDDEFCDFNPYLFMKNLPPLEMVIPKYRQVRRHTLPCSAPLSESADPSTLPHDSRAALRSTLADPGPGRRLPLPARPAHHPPPARRRPPSPRPPPIPHRPSPRPQALLPRKTRQCPRKTLVLDLDETLVHSSLEPVPDSDFTFPVHFNASDHTVHVRTRPHMKVRAGRRAARWGGAAAEFTGRKSGGAAGTGTAWRSSSPDRPVPAQLELLQRVRMCARVKAHTGGPQPRASLHASQPFPPPSPPPPIYPSPCLSPPQEFLERMAALYEVVVFTASQRIYAERLLDILDPGRKLVRHRCVCRCAGGWARLCRCRRVGGLCRRAELQCGPGWEAGRLCVRAGPAAAAAGRPHPGARRQGLARPCIRPSLPPPPSQRHTRIFLPAPPAQPPPPPPPLPPRIYRESCVYVDGNYLKDLTVLGRDLAHTLIVDNSPQVGPAAWRGNPPCAGG